MSQKRITYKSVRENRQTDRCTRTYQHKPVSEHNFCVRVLGLKKIVFSKKCFCEIIYKYATGERRGGGGGGGVILVSALAPTETIIVVFEIALSYICI